MNRSRSENHKPLRPAGKSATKLWIIGTRTGEAPAAGQALEYELHPLGRPPMVGTRIGEAPAGQALQNGQHPLGRPPMGTMMIGTQQWTSGRTTGFKA